MSRKKKFRQNDNNYAICYYRYSSHSQNDASIEQQREQAHKYAEKHGLSILKEYSDKALTGTSTKRPQYQLMLSEVSKLRPAYLILWKVDRLGRDRIELAIAKKELREAGCQPVYVAESLPDSAPEAAMMEAVLEGMAEFYSEQLSVNITRGIQYNAENALYNGRKIFGYTVGDNKKYVADIKTAPVVQRIFNDYSKGIPMAEIARNLNKQGFVTTTGGAFTVNSLRNILHNKAYIGIYKYSGVVVEGGMPALVDKSVFDEVQSMFALNKRKGGQFSRGLDENGNPRFWLTGKLFCGECGQSMQGFSGTSKMGKRYFYYACSGQRKHLCRHKPVKKETVENMVIRILQHFLSDDENLASLAVDVSKYYQDMYGDDSFLKSLEAEKKETETALNNIIRAIEKGIFTASTQQRLLELEKRKDSLSETIEREKLKRESTADTHSIAKYFSIYKNADFDNPEIRNAVLEYFVDKIYLFDDRIVVNCWWDDLHEDVDFEEIKDGISKITFEDGTVMFDDLSVSSTMQKDFFGSPFAIKCSFGT